MQCMKIVFLNFRGNEELRQTLEDHILILQSMASSKYALKLLDNIKRWEKNLHTVVEVFEVWQVRLRRISSGQISSIIKFEKHDKAFSIILRLFLASFQLDEFCFSPLLLK